MSAEVLLMAAAFILFVLSAVGVPDAPRFRLVAAGLACATLALLLPHIG